MISFPFEVGILCWVSTLVFWVAVVVIFTCGVRAMMLCSASDKKSIDWKAYRDYVIGAGVSVVVPALLFAIAA